jgi:CheY-like chemotaxis protein
VSGLESKKLSLEFAEFLLSTAVRDATRDILPLAHAHNASVSCLLEPALPDRVIGDAASIRSLLAGLFSAAIHSAKGGEIKLSVFPSGQNDLTLELTFEVTSSGPGSVPADPVFGESGFIASAKDVARLLGGELGVHSQTGAAPVFWSRIPVQQSISRRAAEVRRSAAEQSPDTAGQSNSPVRILMAEDNSINQRVGKLILQKAGYIIDLVGDGSEAVEAHRTEPYDMILMDCQMPTMDGFEATRRIRANSRRQPVIIAVTANALVGERERCLAAGMDDYLSKPFQAEQLVAIVAKWVKSAETR